MNFSEKQYVNKTALVGHTVVDSVLFCAYFLELVKGSRTIGYFSVFAAMAVIPVVIEWIFYWKNPESKVIQHLIGTTYSTLYVFAIFTTNSMLAFAYAFPMFMLIILYMDVKYNVAIGVGGTFFNILYVIYHGITAGYEKTEIPDVEIRIAAMALTSLFMVVSAAAVTKVNDYKRQQIQEQTDKANALMEKILDTSQGMIENIQTVTNQMDMLGASVSGVQDSMSEVSTGSTETAESVQTQMQKTEQIQQHISKVKDTAALMEQNIRENARRVEDGKKQMDALTEQVDKSMKANTQVMEKMASLTVYTGQMHSIIETITSIADSTGLLALNASIEAARAGESGRGFAVVAGQISELSNQTQTATSNITELIEHINQELNLVAEAVDVVTKSNEANAESTNVVKDNFTGISSGTEEIERQTDDLVETIQALETANEAIVENIQTISAITEEISAHANETFTACEENARLVGSIGNLVAELNEEAKQLQKED